MNNVGNWVLGGSSAVLGVGGLFVAAQAGPGTVGYYGGLAMFAICFLFRHAPDPDVGQPRLRCRADSGPRPLSLPSARRCGRCASVSVGRAA